jgi:pyrroline-5-carboxylate reductase
MNYKVGFIGCGNMGGALVKAVALSLQKGEIAVCDYNEEKTSAMAKEYGAIPVSAEKIAKYADFVVLGVKPQGLEETVSSIAPFLQERSDVTVVTMAAGISIAAVQSFIKKALPVIRIMPNTPVALGEGMILYSLVGVCEKAHNEFLSYFAKAGVFACIPEEEIDAGGALSGCGPAFVYLFTEALIDGARALGLSEEQAKQYAIQTVKGAAEMMQTYQDPTSLRKAVCSPNGTTLAGIAAMEKEGFSSSVKAAVQAAYNRTLELKK